MFWLAKFFTKGKTVKDAIKYFHTINGRMPNNIEIIKIKNSFMDQTRKSNVIDITSRIKDDWWKRKGMGPNWAKHKAEQKIIKDEDTYSALLERHGKELEGIDTKQGVGFYRELGDTLKKHSREELEFQYNEMFNKILDKAKRIDRDPKVLLEAELGKKLTGEETTTQLLDLFSKRPKKASGGIARVGMSKGKLAKWLLSLGKKPKIKKDRLATADELEEYESILDPTGVTGDVGEGMTVKELDKMVADHKAYERHMYDQYKTGKLDPVAGEKTEARRKFLQQKLDEAELSGDNRLITRDEMDELESFNLSVEDIKIFWKIGNYL